MKTSTILLFALLAIFLTSCSQFFYAPNMQNLPVFEEKGETRVTAGIEAGGAGDYAGYGVQAAYSFHEHWGVIANGSYHTRRRRFFNSRQELKFAEAGIGYFTRLKEKNGFALHFDTYGGYGMGKYSIIRGIGNFSHLSFDRFFIQSSLGWKWKFNAFSFALIPSLRLAWLAENKIIVSHVTAPLQIDFRFISMTNFPIQVEPAQTFQLSYKKFRLQHQLVLSFGESRMGSDATFVMVNTGISYIFN